MSVSTSCHVSYLAGFNLSSRLPFPWLTPVAGIVVDDLSCRVFSPLQLVQLRDDHFDLIATFLSLSRRFRQLLRSQGAMLPRSVASTPRMSSARCLSMRPAMGCVCVCMYALMLTNDRNRSLSKSRPHPVPLQQPMTITSPDYGLCLLVCLSSRSLASRKRCIWPVGRHLLSALSSDGMFRKEIGKSVDQWYNEQRKEAMKSFIETRIQGIPENMTRSIQKTYGPFLYQTPILRVIILREPYSTMTAVVVVALALIGMSV
jgi:hypothetical protein